MSAESEAGTPFKQWMCLVCGWIYDEEAGSPEEGIAAGTRWADVAPNWTCPECGAPAQTHRACRACGTYRGRKVLTVAEA